MNKSSLTFADFLNDVGIASDKIDDVMGDIYKLALIKSIAEAVEKFGLNEQKRMDFSEVYIRSSEKGKTEELIQILDAKVKEIKKDYCLAQITNLTGNKRRMMEEKYSGWF